MIRLLIIVFALGILSTGFTTGCAEEEKNDEPEVKDSDDTDEDAGNDDAGNDAATNEDNVDTLNEDAIDQDEDSGSNLNRIAAALETRRVNLDLRERDVIQREQLLNSLENEAAHKTKELAKLKTDLEKILKTLEDKYNYQREELAKAYKQVRAQRVENLKEAVGELSNNREDRISHLLKTIKGMRPVAGAGMLSSMSPKDAIMVLRRLGSRQTAALLGSMDQKTAAQLAEGMLGPKVPTLDNISGMGEEEASAEKVEGQ